MHFIQPTQIWLSFRAKNLRVTSHEILLLVAKHSLVSISMHHGNNHDHRPVSVLVRSSGALRYMIMTRPIDDTASKMVKSGHFI